MHGDSELGRAVRGQFLLEDGITFLNHGSFGATPRAVLAAADEWRRRMEAQPVRFMQRELPAALNAAIERLARFVGARGGDLVLVDNATTGVNAVLRALDLQPGEELLTTTHVYGAVRKTIRYIAARTGAVPVEAEVPFPVAGEEEILAAIVSRFMPRTRLLVVDHITSPTALIFPVARLVAAARARGIAVLVDGAHAPGMLDLDVPALGADFYVGNCHKWLFAPKGCGFLWADPRHHASLHPTVISHGYGEGLRAEFGWTGTRDPSAWLALPAALDFIESIGAARLRQRNHALLLAAVRLLTEAWWSPAGGPPDLLGSMATLGLPADHRFARKPPAHAAAVEIHDYLWDTHRIEVPVVPFGGRLWLRISAQIYNALDDYRRLAEALRA